jgi:hypothetical protein
VCTLEATLSPRRTTTKGTAPGGRRRPAAAVDPVIQMNSPAPSGVGPEGSAAMGAR